MKKSFVTSLVASLVLVGLAGCNANQVKPGPEGGDEKTLSSIAVTANPTKVTYEVGENFASAGLVVTATYSDQSKEAVTGYTLNPAEGYTFVEADMPSKEFTVTYQEKTAKFTVTVNAATPVATGIRVTSEPTDKDYKVGEALNTEGLAVELVMSDGNNQALNEFTTDPANGYVFVEEDVGQKTITVNAQGFSTSFAVTVAEADPVQTGIAVEIREGVVYYVDDEFDKETLKVEAVFDKGENQELAADQFTVSLADNYVFQEEDMAEGVNVVVESGTFSEQINLPVIERTWQQKVEKFLSDLGMNEFEYDEEGNVVSGDYTLTEILSQYLYYQQKVAEQKGYDLPEYEIESDLDEGYIELYCNGGAYNSNVGTLLFYGFLGLSQIHEITDPETAYPFDWIIYDFDCEDLTAGYIADSYFYFVSFPNEKGNAVCADFYFMADDAGNVEVTIDFYLEQAISGEDAQANLEEGLEGLGLTDTAMFLEDASMADVAPWYFFETETDDEDKLTSMRFSAPVYSVLEETEGTIQNAFEESIDDEKWDIDNRFANYDGFGNFAKSVEAVDGKQVWCEYQLDVTTFESEWWEEAVVDCYNNTFSFEFNKVKEEVPFANYKAVADQAILDAGFSSELVLPSPNVRGWNNSDIEKGEYNFSCLEPEAVDTYQDKAVAYFEESALWTVNTTSAGYSIVRSVEEVGAQIVEILVYSDIAEHRFYFELSFKSAPKQWDVAGVQGYIAANGFSELTVPSLSGEIWLHEISESGSYYIHTPCEDETLLDEYLALFSDDTIWNVTDFCEVDGEGNRTTFKYQAQSVVGSSEDNDLIVNVYFRFEDGEFKVSISTQRRANDFPTVPFAQMFALQGWATNLDAWAQSYAHSAGYDEQYGVEDFNDLVLLFLGNPFHMQQGYDPDENVYMFYAEFENNQYAVSNLSYLFASALGFGRAKGNEAGTIMYVLNDATTQDVVIVINGTDANTVTLTAYIGPNPNSFNAANVNAAFAAIQYEGQFSNKLNYDVNLIGNCLVEVSVEEGELQLTALSAFESDDQKAEIIAAFIAALEEAGFVQGTGYDAEAGIYVFEATGEAGAQLEASIEIDAEAGTISLTIMGVAPSGE